MTATPIRCRSLPGYPILPRPSTPPLWHNYAITYRYPVHLTATYQVLSLGKNFANIRNCTSAPSDMGDATAHENHSGPMAPAFCDCGILQLSLGWYSLVARLFHLDVPLVLRPSSSASLGNGTGPPWRGHVHGHLALPTPLSTLALHAWVRP